MAGINKKSPLFFSVLIVCLCGAAHADPTPKDCHSIADSYCMDRGPVIITQGASAQIKALSHKKTDFPVPADAGENLSEPYCPDKKCSCEEDISYIVWGGDGAGIAKINAKEMREAKEYGKCSLEVLSIMRQPNFVYASPAIVSSAIFNLTFNRGDNGGCHGNTVVTTYNVANGDEYKIKDIVAPKDMGAMAEALADEFVTLYAKPELEQFSSEEQAKQFAALKKEIITDEHLADAGIYVEKNKVFTNIDGFRLSCASGSFHPVEIPVKFVDTKFLALLKAKAQ